MPYHFQRPSVPRRPLIIMRRSVELQCYHILIWRS
nr:MAG TPA: hypothetical protein [Caudoviricetes sp.]